jgi:hypothetical protein
MVEGTTVPSEGEPTASAHNESPSYAALHIVARVMHHLPADAVARSLRPGKRKRTVGVGDCSRCRRWLS